jgi:hypothetical protein
LREMGGKRSDRGYERGCGSSTWMCFFGVQGRCLCSARGGGQNVFASHGVRRVNRSGKIGTSRPRRDEIGCSSFSGYFIIFSLLFPLDLECVSPSFKVVHDSFDSHRVCQPCIQLKDWNTPARMNASTRLRHTPHRAS